MGEDHHKSKNDNLSQELKDFIQTYITYNKGGNWHLINAPDRDSEGKKYDCGENCHLNLHGSSNKFPQFYNVQKALGIILGNGNVGQYLSSNEENISTFMSIDGGFTWSEVS